MLRNKQKGIVIVLIAIAFLGIMAPYQINAEKENQELYLDALENKVEETYNTTIITKKDYITRSQIKANVIYPNSKYISNHYTYDNMTFIRYLVQQGQTVKEGDPIALLRIAYDPSIVENLRLSVQREEESLQSLNDEYQKLSKQYLEIQTNSTEEAKRTLAKALYDRLQITYQQEKQEKEASILKIKQQQQSYLELEDSGTEVYLYANCTGIIARLNRLYENDAIKTGDFIAVISDMSELQISIEGGSTALRYHMPVTVTQKVANETLSVEGRVITYNSGGLSSNLMYENTIIEVYGENASLLQNKEVTVEFQTAVMEDVLVVDSKAVLNDKLGSYIYLLENGMRKKQYIICGASNGEMTWIIKGAAQGDIVLMN